MKKINKYIEIVSSSIPELSSMSKESYDMMLTSLEKRYKKVGITTVDTDLDLQKIVDKNPDVVFLGVKRVPKAEETLSAKKFIWLPTFLDNNGIRYTGSDAKAMKIESEKAQAKVLIKKADVTTPESYVAYTKQFTNESQLPLPFPVFIKPPNLGASVGIDDSSVARNFLEYKKKVRSLAKNFDSEALVEKYLTGREFTVAIFKPIEDEPLQAFAVELTTEPNKNGDVFLSQELKSSPSQPQITAVEDGELKDAIITVAMGAFTAIKARDYGRIDIRLDENKVPHFLEANLIPSTIEGASYFQDACRLNSDLSYEDMLVKIIDLALERDEFVPEPVKEVVSDDSETDTATTQTKTPSLVTAQ